MEHDLISHCESELSEAIRAVQQPRSDFQLVHFVVGQHDTDARRWWQCVLELDRNIRAVKRAAIKQRQLERRIAELSVGSSQLSVGRCETCKPITTDNGQLTTDHFRDEAALLRLDLEEQELAILGTLREIEALYAIYQSFGRTFTREELEAAEAEYWQKRLVRQARQSLAASGSPGAGNLEALEQIGAIESELGRATNQSRSTNSSSFTTTPRAIS